ncbi:MAG: hypothetical protein QOG49_1165 [Frankiaceae bacterium]|nr:hypothetical protein [Frankiaceae bacterium]
MVKAKPPKLYLSGEPAADALLSTDPLALLIGMVLDQQIPLEWAFAAPAKLRERLGRDLDAADIAGYDEDALVRHFTGPPALHRFPGSMAKRVQAMCAHLVDAYDGDASALWTGASDGADLLARVKALPGFGEQKARIFVGLLGKQYGVATAGWQEAAGDFGRPGTYLSVADITDPESLQRVRAHKKDMKAAAKAAQPAAAAAPKRKRAAAR